MDLERDLQKDKDQSRDLRFQYRTVANDKQLTAIAAEVAAEAGNAALTAKEVVTATIRALRQDGVIHLIDPDSDTYLLISRENVLDPYIRRSLSRKQRSLPFYLQKVPYARIEYARKCICCEVNIT
jgi:hypothetical protein